MASSNLCVVNQAFLHVTEGCGLQTTYLGRNSRFRHRRCVVCSLQTTADPQIGSVVPCCLACSATPIGARFCVSWCDGSSARQTPSSRGLLQPCATKLRTPESLGWAWPGEVLGRRPSTPFFSKTPKLADWLQQPPNAASGGCQCRNAPQRVPARHPAPKTRCAALLAGVLGHRSQKMQKQHPFSKK